MAKVVKLPEKTPIPSNWIWVELGKLSYTKSGYPFDSKRFSGDKEGKRPIIRIRDVVRGYTETYTDEDCPKDYIINRGEILIGMDGDFNLEKWNNSEALLNQRVCRIQSTSELLLDDFMYYYLPVPLKLINEATPSITVKHLSTKTIAKIPFPLPPLPEQQRIVARIESLFAKLDEAKEKAQAVVDGFELRKSAILHKAFSGELTARWRKEHKAEEWLISQLGQYTESQYGYTESASKEPIGPKFLRITDIQNGTVNWDDVPYCNISQEDFEKYSIRQGDIMIARTGATTGKSYLVAEDVSAVFASYLIRLTLKRQGLIAAYLYNFMQSQSYWQQITEFSTGIAQPGVNAKKLKEIKLPIPSILEQNEIVSTLDKTLKKEQQAKESAEAVLDQIDTMKKAILARAFRGELGTNDPKEEWAGELVKTVL